MSMTFAAFLAMCRESLQQTQAQIAARCAITPEAISMFETGRRKPSLTLLPCLADALRVDRGLLCRYALQCRALELYDSLHLPRGAEHELESARHRTPAVNPLLEDSDEPEELDSNWTQRAEGRGWLEPDDSAESPKQPC